MRGHGLKSACIIISVFILLSLLLFPGISHAVRYGHIKQVEEPVPPEIKCGEPGEDPNFNILGALGFPSKNYGDSIIRDMIEDDDSRHSVALMYFLRFMRFVIDK